MKNKNANYHGDYENCLKRKQIVSIWESSNKYDDYYCCPDCRDILTKEKRHPILHCCNAMCRNEEYYDYSGEPIDGYSDSDLKED